MNLDFRSDNSAPPSPSIVQAIVAASTDGYSPYSNDVITTRLRDRMGAIFDRDVEIFPLMTGTATNALILSMVARSFGKVFCHADSHIVVDECGAVEFFSAGSRLAAIDGVGGKITRREIDANDEPEDVHRLRAGAVSITQATERGTVYSVAEVKDLADAAHMRGIPFHMDGTRLSNALVHSKASPADGTWASGVDVLSFGATKGGALGAEAAIFFDKALARDFSRQIKRSGHMVSKGWFISAQLEAYIADDLWLRNAAHGNAMATRLAEGISDTVGFKPEFPVEANIVFVRMPESRVRALEQAGVQFYRWDRSETPLLRLVTSHATSMDDVESFIEIAAGRTDVVSKEGGAHV